MVEVRIKEKPERPRGDDHVRQVNKPSNFFKRRWDDLIRAEDWMSEKSGLGNFVDNIKRFQKADRAYTEDQGLGFLENCAKSCAVLPKNLKASLARVLPGSSISS